MFVADTAPLITEELLKWGHTRFEGGREQGSGAKIDAGRDDEGMRQFEPLDSIFKGRHFEREIIDFPLLRQDSWTGRRASLALPKSRPLSRRSGCVSAEPYPTLRSVQSARDARLENDWPFTQKT